MLLRYVLRFLLALALLGNFMALLTHVPDPKRRADLKKRLGRTDASCVLLQTRLELAAGAFRNAGIGANMGKGMVELGGPDLRDSCAVM